MTHFHIFLPINLQGDFAGSILVFDNKRFTKNLPGKIPKIRNFFIKKANYLLSFQNNILAGNPKQLTPYNNHTDHENNNKFFRKTSKSHNFNISEYRILHENCIHLNLNSN